ncbi:MAG: hypothetical protein K2K55_07020 [Duncaniella sp.]|nr:hypothetical protein [Duncaniella sp.]
MKYQYPKLTLGDQFHLLRFPLLVLIVIFAMGLVEKTDYTSDGQWMKVKDGARLITYFGNDTIEQPLAKGDSVRFIGYDNPKFRSEYLVETSDGRRGFIYNWWVDVPMIIKSKKHYGDSMTINTPPRMRHTKYGYEYPLKDEVTGILTSTGVKVKIKPLEFVPAVKDVEKYEIGKFKEGFTRIMSKSKFDKISQGLSLTEASSKIGPVTETAVLKDGTIRTLYHDYVFNSADGKFYRPEITFGADSVAVSTGLVLARDRNPWLLKILPFADCIFDLPVTSYLSRTSIYNYNGFLYTSNSTPMKIARWTLGILFFAGFLIWLFAISIIPYGMIDYILYHPRLLFPVSDLGVRIISAMLGAIFAYYWIVVLLGWGAYWWAILLVIGCSCFLWEVFSSPLENTVPHCRCQNCRAMYTMILVNKDFLNSEHATENKSRSRTVAQNRTRTKHYTEVRRNGYKIREEDVRYTTQVDSTIETDHYKENVRYDNYMLHYQCEVCGYRERKRMKDRNVLDRQYKGTTSHQESHTYNY